VTVTDDEGDSDVLENAVSVGAVEMQDDPCAGGMLLAVGGTAAGDHMVFEPGQQEGDVLVTLNGTIYGSYQPTGRLLAFGQDGDDVIQVAGSISLSAWLYGDGGDDRLKGGGGHDVLFGELGNDLLVGQSGRDVLIGGPGADRIVGNGDDDILIAGWLNFADRDEALCAITKEWNSGREYEIRILNLYDASGSAQRENGDYYLVAGQTVVEDEDRDVLTGSAGMDWFFFEEGEDRATDLKDEAFANELDWILAE
jgi:Ca2+-binding RTX toxin-like protein